MDFHIEEDFGIFDPLFKKRPEITLESLKQDLKNYYIPYVEKLMKLKQEKSGGEGLIVGTSAIQGTGKTTQGEILEALLAHFGCCYYGRT